jgi:hypothetical protein
MKKMREQYGDPEKAKRVFYATAKKQGQTPGADADDEYAARLHRTLDRALDLMYDRHDGDAEGPSQPMWELTPKGKAMAMSPATDRAARLHRTLDRCLDALYRKRARDTYEISKYPSTQEEQERRGEAR